VQQQLACNAHESAGRPNSKANGMDENQALMKKPICILYVFMIYVKSAFWKLPVGRKNHYDQAKCGAKFLFPRSSHKLILKN